jgi:3-deoxy-D-manno-octulosonic-acid transferase
VFGKPIVFGPYMQNFAEIARTFLDNGAAIQVRSGRELDSVLLELLGDPVRRARLGAAARALVEANRGARVKTLSAIAQLLPPDDPANVVRPFRRV